MGAGQPGVKVDPYTRRDRIRAVNWSAFIGWVYFAGKYLVEFRNPGGLLYFAIWGLPVAFALTWLSAAPILFWMIRGPVSWWAAAAWGAGVSALMAALGFGLARFQGWRASQNPNFHYTIGGGEFVRDVDGVLTPYGWWIAIQGAVEFVILGTIVALVVRAFIGTGTQSAPVP